jgi:hypothetical protein
MRGMLGNSRRAGGDVTGLHDLFWLQVPRPETKNSFLSVKGTATVHGVP